MLEYHQPGLGIIEALLTVKTIDPIQDFTSPKIIGRFVGHIIIKVVGEQLNAVIGIDHVFSQLGHFVIAVVVQYFRGDKYRIFKIFHFYMAISLERISIAVEVSRITKNIGICLAELHPANQFDYILAIFLPAFQ